MKVSSKIYEKNIILKPFSINDIEDVFAFASDSDVAINAGWLPHKCLSDSADVIMNTLSKPNEWAIELLSENKVIGSISISSDLQEPTNPNKQMLSFLLNKDYWGKSYAFEATSSLINHLQSTNPNLTLTAYHYDSNNRSEALIKRLGFQYINFQDNLIKNINNELVGLHYYELKNH